MEIKDYIIKNYSRCPDSPDKCRVELLYSIIQLKSLDSASHEIERTLYCDIKDFIISYLNSLDNRDYGYDKINIKKIISAINECKDPKERLELLRFLNRLLIKNGFIDESNSIKKYIDATKSDVILIHEKGMLKYSKLILHYTSYNLFTIILSLFIIYLLSTVILLPTDNLKHAFFVITYDHYSNSQILNHFLNTLAGIFGISDNYKVLPINLFGLLIFIILKAFYIVFIINYLYKKCLELIQL